MLPFQLNSLARPSGIVRPGIVRPVLPLTGIYGGVVRPGMAELDARNKREAESAELDSIDKVSNKSLFAVSIDKESILSNPLFWIVIGAGTLLALQTYTRHRKNKK